MRTVEVDVPFDFCSECENFRMGIRETDGKEAYTCLLRAVCENAVQAANSSQQTKMADDLRPCELCGSEEVRTETIDRFEGPDTFIVVCNRCGHFGPEAKTEEEAAKAWNEM